MKAEAAEEEIRELVAQYAANLKQCIDDRVSEMKHDDKSHFLIYRVLGVTDEEDQLIDFYQNEGRLLYKYAGSFLENAAKKCFQHKYPQSGSLRIQNTWRLRPKTFEIDCLVDLDAIEIKWRDATTDGDHTTKEHTRIQAIDDAGYKPIRVMFYYPNRSQAMKIQEALETLYHGVDGEYHFGNQHGSILKSVQDVDLHGILQKLAHENTSSS